MNTTDEQCSAAMSIRGEWFGCDRTADHSGWTHTNQTAQAEWRDQP